MNHFIAYSIDSELNITMLSFEKNTLPILLHHEGKILSPFLDDIFLYSPLIYTTLSTYIKHHNLKNPLISFLIRNKNIIEYISETPQQINNDHNYYWQHYEISHSMHYHVGIPHEIMLQCHLLISKKKIPVIILTTSFMALLSAYKKHFHDTVIPINDIMEIKNYIESLEFPFTSSYQCSKQLYIESLGLFYLTEVVYETN